MMRPVPSLTGVMHTSVTVADIERSLAFYRDLLGLVVVGRQESDRPYLATITGFPGVVLKMAFLKVDPNDQHLLELLEYASHPAEMAPAETHRPGKAHLCYRVDDIEAMHRWLTANGVTFMSPPALITHGVNTGARACYLRDPDGFTLELYEAPRRPAEPGPTGP